MEICRGGLRGRRARADKSADILEAKAPNIKVYWHHDIKAYWRHNEREILLILSNSGLGRA